MSLNPFDETLDEIEDEQHGGAAPAANPFLDTLDEIDRSRSRGLRVSVNAASKTTPDRAADVARLAEQTGVAAAVVERNFDQMQQRFAIDSTPVEQIAAESPATAAFIKDPAKLAIVRDDLEQLGALEWLVTAPGRSFARGMHQIEVGTLRAASMSRALTREEHDRLDAARFHMKAGGALGVGDSWFRGAVSGSAGQLPILFGALLSAATRVPIGAGAGAAIGAAGGALAGGVGAGPGAIAGATFGAGRAAVIGGAEFAFQLEAGLALDEYLDEKDELGNAIDPNAAKGAAVAAGVVNAGLEVVGLGILLKTIPGIEKLTAGLLRPAVKAALRAPTTRALLAEAGALYAGTVAKETAVEVAQRVVTIVAGEAGKLASGQDFKSLEPGEVVSDLGHEALGALQSFALLSLPGPTLTAARASQRAAEAAQNVDFFKALGGAVTRSKTLERMPEALQEFLGQATKDGPIEKVYAPIDTFTAYWQEQGRDPAEVAAELTGDRVAYEQAVRTGEDLVISTAAYAVKVAGTEHNAYFANELRLAPDEMNAREAAVFIEEQKAAAAAAKEDATAADTSTTAPIRAALQQQLEAAGVEPTTAAAYVDLYESTFANLAERAGVDPVELYAQYGLTVERPELATQAARVKVGRSPAAQAAFATLTAERVEEGAAVRGTPADVPDNPVARQLEAERTAPPDRYEPYVDVLEEFPAIDVVTQGPRAVLKAYFDTVQGPNALGVTSEIDAVIARTARSAKTKGEQKTAILDWIRRREIQLYEHEQQQQIDSPATALDPKTAPQFKAARRFLGVLDKNTAPEQTTEGTTDAGTEQEANRLLDKSWSPAGGRVAASDPGNAKNYAERAAKHTARVFAAVLDSARALDPEVNEVDLRAEFDYRVEFYNDQHTLAAEGGNTPHAVLRAIAAYGGIAERDDGKGLAGELRLLKEGTKFGKLAGVSGVFRKKKYSAKGGSQRGHALDVMLQMLQADPEFSWIESVDMLLDQIDEASRHSEDRISKTELPGTEELRDVGIRREVDWWSGRPWRPMDLLQEDVDESEIAATEGDTSFDVTEFDQGLFDRQLFEEFEALKPDEGADVLTTGEQQPRLPEAGQVREQEVATPEVADLPFSLTAPVATPGKKNAGQTTLFQEDQPLTRESVQQWAADIQELAGPDLRSFVVNLTLKGDISLDSIIVERGAQRAGLGSKVLKMLTRFADQHGARLILTPGQRDPINGTTSRARLVKFYKRFGFVENTGRHADLSISAGMLREPTLPFALKAQDAQQAREAATEPVASPEYQAASTAMAEADRAFAEVTRRYRAREIGDAEYMAARQERDAAAKRFDEAFEAEQGRELGQDPKDGGETKKERRGAIRFGNERQFSITLLQRADLSTFLHETGHFYLEVFGDLVGQLRGDEAPTDQQRQAIADYDALLKWFGVESREAIGTEQHEQFARAFEAYLLEGRAPSQQLRAAFARFRAWLVGIYRSIKGLRVELTDDVRRVLDRMVASDAAIARAEQEGRVAPMFTTAEEAGMSPAEFELYRRTVADASNAAREGLETQLLAEVQREQQAAWKTQRTTIRETVAGETHRMPVYQVLAAMQHGKNPDGSQMVEGLDTPPLKMSRRLLVQQFGEERLKRLPRPYVYSSEGGMDPGIIAGMYGFSSADEMLQAIETAEPMKARIERETDRRMLVEHGSILLDGTLQEKALAAVANDHREAIIRAELRALAVRRRDVAGFVKAGQAAVDAERAERNFERRWFEAEAKLRIAIAEGHKQVEIDALKRDVAEFKAKARGGARIIRAAQPRAETLREAARVRIAATRVRDIRPDVFWHASRKAAQKAIDAAARQDFDAAITAKQQELLNLALFREATRVKTEIEDRVKAAIDLARPEAQKRLGLAGESYVAQVNAILDRYEFARQSGKALDRRGALRQWVAAMKAEGFAINVPDDVIDDARRVHYKELTVDELFGVTDALTQIVHLSRLKNRLLKSAAGRAYSELRDRLVASITEHNTVTKTPVESRPEDERWSSVADIFASHIKIGTLARVMDGGHDNGLMFQTFIRPLNDARDDERVRLEAAAVEMAKTYTDHYSRAERAAFGEKRSIPAIGDSLSKEARLAVALNWGSATSQDRLVNDPTRGWNRIQIQAILDTLDERDWRFVQATWRTVGQFWGEIVAMETRLSGLAPEKVEGVEIATTFGPVQGAYYPLVFDSRRVARSKEIELDARALGAAAYAATNRGHTEARKKHVQLSVRLDLMAGQGHIEQVVHDLTHREVISDVSRLLRDRQIAAAIFSTRGPAAHQQFVSAVSAIAHGQAPLTGADKAFRFVRSRTTLALLGLNVWTGLQQPLGLFNGAQRVGVTWVARGLARWVTDAATMQGTVGWIWNVSPMMRARGEGFLNQDLADLRQTLGIEGGWFDTMVRTATRGRIGRRDVLEAFMWHISRMQRIADVPTWLGAYEKAMEGGVDEKTAIALADQAVLDSQGGFDVKDLADIQRGSEAAKLFLLFYSYGNTVLNSAYAAGATKNLRSPAEVARLLSDLSLLYIAPAMGTVALGLAFGRKEPEEDDEVGDFVRDVGRESLSSAMNGFILVRELAAWTREDGGVRGYSGPAGTRLIQLLFRLKTQVAQGEADVAAFRALAETAGVLFGIPITQIEKTIDGLTALEEGRTENPGVLLVGAPKD